MSAMPERREPIDIEEFERRLRAPERIDASNDPLADLAGLVAGQGKPARDPFASIFGDAPSTAAATGKPDNALDFPDLRPILRRAEPDFPRPEAAPAVELAHPEEFHPSAEYENWAGEQEIAPDAIEPAPRQRSRKPLYLTAAVIALGFVGVAGSLAFRGGATSPSGVTIIKAASGPTKVQAQDTAANDAPARDASILDKSAPPAVKKVVSRDEQPIDVGAAEKSPRVIPLADNAPAAARVPTPPPPARASEPQSAASVFPEPKKVKTVAVRADGSIISSVTAPAPAPAQAKQAPTPPVSPAKNATPKTEARAAATSTTTPAAPKPVAAKPVAAKPQPAAPKPAVAEKPKQVATAAPQDDETDAVDTAKPAASGAFAIQLGAPGSEHEARQMAQRLGEKYSGQLGGRRPSVQKASDKAVWRVRVGGMSREAAAGACDKIKAAGGACFVAR